MTLDEFLSNAPLTLDSFAEATRRMFDNGDVSFNPNDRRTELWWWKEIAAYLQCMSQEEQNGWVGDERRRQDRRRGYENG